MRKQDLMKWLLALLMVASLLAVFVPAALAQEDGEGAETTEQVEAAEGEAAEAEEEGGSPLDPLGINTGLLLVQIFNFLILLVIVRAVLWQPAVNMLDSRSEKIQKGLEDAAAAAKARQNAEQEAEKILQEARTERARVIEEARSQGDEVARSIKKEAEAEAQRILEEAQTDAKAARDAELADLREQVLNISTALAGRIIQENLDAKKQSTLVDRFFTEVPADAKKLSGTVEVISAMPLSDDEQSKVKKEIGAEEVHFRVDPEILGGLILRTSDRVIDGSVRSGLTELTSRLN